MEEVAPAAPLQVDVGDGGGVVLDEHNANPGPEAAARKLAWFARHSSPDASDTVKQRITTFKENEEERPEWCSKWTLEEWKEGARDQLGRERLFSALGNLGAYLAPCRLKAEFGSMNQLNQI